MPTTAQPPIEVCGIAVRARPRAAMEVLPSASVTVQGGVESDARGRPGKRQVTVLSRESWRLACAELGEELPWTLRRANILVSGIEFGPQSVGKLLQFGSLTLEVTRETDPCRRMDAAHLGLQAALAPDWRGGVCCRVVSGGLLETGQRGLLSSGPLQGSLLLS